MFSVVENRLINTRWLIDQTCQPSTCFLLVYVVIVQENVVTCEQICKKVNNSARFYLSKRGHARLQQDSWRAPHWTLLELCQWLVACMSKYHLTITSLLHLSRFPLSRRTQSQTQRPLPPAQFIAVHQKWRTHQHLTNTPTMRLGTAILVSRWIGS